MSNAFLDAYAEDVDKEVGKEVGISDRCGRIHIVAKCRTGDAAAAVFGTNDL